MAADRKKIDKIYLQIKKLASKGRDYSLDYDRLVDDIVIKGDLAHYQMCLADYYNIDTDKYRTVYEIKKESWKSIIFQTDSDFISKMRALYKKELIYQQGYQIRSDNPLYANYSVQGPLRPLDITLSKTYAGSVIRTKYESAGTPSQIAISRTVTSTFSSIDISLVDENVYQIDVHKVIWATFSTNLFTYVVSTQSAIEAGDLLVVQLKELDELGGIKDGGAVSTVSVRTNSIYSDSTKAQFVGAYSGDRFRIDIFGLYRDPLEVERALGISDASSVSEVEAHILEVRKAQDEEFSSPYEVGMINSISSGTQSSLSIETPYRSGIPMDHGADYLVTAYRRGNPEWITSTASETYSYRVAIRKEDLLGTINEVDSDSIGPGYYNINETFALYKGFKKTYLEVQRAGSTQSITVVYDNYLQSEDLNLFQRYRIAIDYLNS